MNWKEPPDKKSAYKYECTAFEVAVVKLLEKHPGITATTFAGLYWPHLKKGGGRMIPQLLAAQRLRLLVHKKIIKKKFIPSPFKPGLIVPQAKYFLTCLGHDMYEYFRRQSGNAPYKN